ncbi:alpha/beta hydrolase [Streptomyces sp. NPDC004752]
MLHQNTVDPALADLCTDPPARPQDIAATRAEHEQTVRCNATPPEHVAVVRDLTAGHVPIRIYRRARTGDRVPVLVLLHGGGWVRGNLEALDGLCRTFANATGFLVVNVDYRLAPEHPYPAALDDVELVLDWLATEADSLDIDTTRIVVGGTSAGGNLAAAVCLRRRGKPTCPALQLLMYPVLDTSMATASARQFATGHRLTRERMLWYVDQYGPGASRTLPEVAPLRADDVSGLPPAYLLLPECDVLRDDGLAYAERLRGAGVPVEARMWQGMIHGFLSFGARVPDQRRAAIQYAVEWLRDRLEPGPRFVARPRSAIEADIARLNPDPDALFAAATDDAVARAEALVRGLMAVLFANPRAFRELEHLQLETSLREGDTPGPVRRRMMWVERALEPAADVLPPNAMRRLRLTLPLVFGTEALLTQLDICRSDAAEATDAMAWAARTLVQAALAESVTAA